MKKNLSFYSLMGICLLAATVFSSCKKDNPLTIPPEVATFTNATGGTYFITAPGVTYEIPVGLTTVSDQDRTISYTVSSPTGAVAGTDYTVTGNSVVIPKGQTTGTIVLSGIFPRYTNGEKDTIVFTLTTPGATPSEYNNTFKVLMRGPCFDGDISFPDLMGDYTKTFENGSYGPYTSTLSTPKEVNSTTSTAVLSNIYDQGIQAEVTFEYSTPGSFTANIANQPTAFTVGGERLYIRTIPGESGSFTYCTPTITLYIQMYTASGIFDEWVMTMAR